MAPTITVDVDAETTPSATDGPTAPMSPALVAPLAPLSSTSVVLPSAKTVGPLLEEQLADAVAEMREGREVHVPADAYPLVRALTGTLDRVEEYEALFKKLKGAINAEIAAELGTAVGVDQAGVPVRNLDVPDEDGTTIKLVREWKTEHTIDREQAVRATVGLAAHRWEAAGNDAPGEAAELFAMAVVDTVVETLLPKAGQRVNITGLEALTALLGERGLDDLAAVASGAYQDTTSTLSRVKVDRSAPAAPKRARIARKRRTAK